MAKEESKKVTKKDALSEAKAARRERLDMLKEVTGIKESTAKKINLMKKKK